MSLKDKIEEHKLNKKELSEVEVSSKHVVLRIILFVLFLGIGISGIVIGCTYDSTHLESGWHEVTAQEGLSNAQDIKFMYLFNKSKRDNASDMKEISTYYTSVCNYSFRLFEDEERYDEFKNLAFINANPNTDITINEDLYNVFKTIVTNSCDVIYYAPIYSVYSELFSSTTDGEAKDNDPYYNDGIKNYFLEVTSFIKNGDIKLVLKENNTINLNISSDYLEYCSQNNIKKYISFNYMYNSVFVDFVADKLLYANLVNFRVYSYDGFVRTHFDNDTVKNSYQFYTYFDNVVVPACTLNLKSSFSLVEIKTFPITTGEDSYVYSDKKFAHHFLDDNGNYSSCIESLILYSNDDSSTLEKLVKGQKAFVMPTLNSNDFKSIGFNFVYNDGNVITYNDSDLEITNVYKTDEITFTKELL